MKQIQEPPQDQVQKLAPTKTVQEMFYGQLLYTAHSLTTAQHQHVQVHLTVQPLLAHTGQSRVYPPEKAVTVQSLMLPQLTHPLQQTIL